jgi:hypothetical protein
MLHLCRCLCQPRLSHQILLRSWLRLRLHKRWLHLGLLSPFLQLIFLPSPCNNLSQLTRSYSNLLALRSPSGLRIPLKPLVLLQGLQGHRLQLSPSRPQFSPTGTRDLSLVRMRGDDFQYGGKEYVTRIKGISMVYSINNLFRDSYNVVIA